MILNNTQANIFKVNGGLADNFANRPLANGSFYLFYSLDTQEIYYDNGAWILISAAGGAPVNIYTSDGTINGDRFINGDQNNNIYWQGFIGHYYFDLSSNYQVVFDNNQINLQKFNLSNNRSGEIILTNNIYTIGFRNTNNNQFRGLRWNDFITFFEWTLGDLNTTAINYQSNQYQFYFNGQPKTYIANTFFSYNTQNNQIKIDADESSSQLTFSSYGKGIRIINNRINIFQNNNTGQTIGLDIDFSNNLYFFGACLSGNRTNIQVADQSNRIVTQNNNNVNGLDLSFTATPIYKFGQFTGGQQTYIQIFDAQKSFSLYSNGSINGIYLDNLNESYFLGKISGGNYTQLQVLENSRTIVTSSNFQENGIKISYSNKIYSFGQITSGNLNRIIIQDNTNDFATYSGINKHGFYYINDQIYVGTESGNITRFFINDTTSLFSTSQAGITKGISLSLSTDVYNFGRISGGNGSTIKIDDNNSFPVEILGTNVTQVTSGSTAGVHLKIKINGTNYVIELKNP
jgi:hypothetical protein